MTNVEPQELEDLIADRSAPRAADAILKNYVVARRTTLVSPPSEAGREMLEAFQRIQGYSDNPGLVYTICSKMIDRLSPDQGTVAVASASRDIPSEELANRWPLGCHSPNSCHRNGRCMYVGCKHDGKDIATLAALAISSTDRGAP